MPFEVPLARRLGLLSLLHRFGDGELRLAIDAEFSGLGRKRMMMRALTYPHCDHHTDRLRCSGELDSEAAAPIRRIACEMRMIG